MSAPRPLKNDCFALPQAVEWTPVRVALDRLKASMTPVTGFEVIASENGIGRILAEPVTARSSHPPTANSAVDGYGFAYSSIERAPDGLDLIAGRSAAGEPFEGDVPLGCALRILTGAKPPRGVDTVVLQEDVTLSDTQVTFEAGLKQGANLRAAGEDIKDGAKIFDAGRRLTSADLAVLASTGVGDVKVHKRLKVGVLSTGDELIGEGASLFDANRPMLLSLLSNWGFDAVDLGQVPDDRDAVRAVLDEGANADAILTTGGASAGDEDHMSAILQDEGSLSTWRIAIKPGRPLALGLWSGVPVFGLPGNPVAAFVCTLLFARPSLYALAGAPWSEPVGFPLIADFEKKKKPGREEYLRARRRGDHVEVFGSEGSGRVSGLSWADGLVMLPHEGEPIKKGMPVRYIPFSEFGC